MCIFLLAYLNKKCKGILYVNIRILDLVILNQLLIQNLTIDIRANI